MCDICDIMLTPGAVSKSLPEIEAIINETERPMRWPKAERIARGFTRDVMEAVRVFEIALLAALPEPQNFYTILNQTRDGVKHARTTDVVLKDMSDGIHRKAWTPEDITVLRQKLKGFGLTAEKLREFEKIFDDLLNSMMIGGGEVNPDMAVFNRWYKTVFQEGLDKAYDDAVVQITRASKEAKEAFKNNVVPVYTFTETSAFVQTTYKNGFELITHVTTIARQGDALDVMVKGLQAGDPWDKIARTLHRRVGVDVEAAWHWRRLIRTEMVGTFDRASKERYANMKVKYLKFSMVPGACPICQNLNSHNSGLYLPAHAPSLPGATHPNCRCRFLPKWNLTKNIKEENLMAKPLPDPVV